MEASTRTLADDDCALNGGWTVVMPRRGRQRKRSNKVERLTETQEPWAPTDAQIDPSNEKALMQKMERSINKVESSQFYHSFRDQLQTPPVSEHLHKVLGSESKMQMVIYGIGSLESYEPPRLQLSLAILMKKDFKWIGEIEVFDPVLSATESRILEALNCSVLSVNEHGRRQVIKPTMFFMPHCEAELYNNLLQANWKLNLLGNVVLFGNSFETCKQVSEINSPVLDSMGYILSARKFTNEFRVKTISDDYFNAFHDSSWHFFSPNLETELQFMSY
ncbi:protein SENSITIVITY TO RED LIGHT REDUCED 1-like [Prosopis cineraria]|uniref:protein SENSITIVITY TO RED LIGHT REDUCED 1-like n=1 Tax=Prosopis cineraria TaxID=364024 RepID=UPI00240F84AA|nr:protein SENSITIVITY TO RED LIGHT REDUCED 1-like [Prosopis cineraria]